MKEAGLKDHGAANRFDPNLKARVDKTPPTIENHPKTIEGTPGADGVVEEVARL
jgi:hypothetical protein